ncbi:MAG: hypothetical protein NVSMB31_15030 [Vulcanimicrobiaceae bacterium]
MKNQYSVGFIGALLCSIATLAACAGGGGSGATPAQAVPSASTPAAQTQSVSGRVVGCDTTYIGTPPTAPLPEPTAAPCVPGTGLAGVTITIGAAPPANVGGAIGGTPTNPLPTVTTAADGSFTVPNVPTGTQYIQAAAPPGAPCAEGAYPNNGNATPYPAAVAFSNSGNFAVYHGAIVANQQTSQTMIKLSALTQDEVCFSKQAFIDRAAILGNAAPSTDPSIDELAQESARAVGVGSETTGVYSSPTCNGGPPCIPLQYGAQYSAMGGLYMWTLGAVIAGQSWQSAEFGETSGIFKFTNPACATAAFCFYLTRPNVTFMGFSEGPNRTNIIIVGIQH